METINIVFSADNNYAQFMGVALCSLFENKKDNYLIDVYVLDGGVSNKNKEKLKILENKYNFKIIYIKIDISFFKDFFISDHITQATYYRIMMPELLPNLKKILYLDCDIIVLGDIYELYNINIDNYFFAAVEEPVTDRQKELGMPINTKYFNAGIMLINLKKWQEFNVSKKLIDFIKNNSKKLKYWDQDAMNAILYNKWLNIHSKNNYTTLLTRNSISKTEKDDISIIHYTEMLKPWNYLSKHPLKKEYFYYLSKTPWSNKKYIDKNIKNIIKKIIKKL